MQSLNASVRSRPLMEARSPSSMTTLPLPPSFSPRNLQAFSPYARLSARTTMKAFPVSGRVSTSTAGIFLFSSCCSVGATAAVSCGAMTTPFTPWLIRVCTLAVSFAMSFWELVVLISAPSSPHELRHVTDVGVPEVRVGTRIVDADDRLRRRVVPGAAVSRAAAAATGGGEASGQG